MYNLFKQLQENWFGFLLFLLGIFFAIFIIKGVIYFLAKTFCWGKFNSSANNGNSRDPMEASGGVAYILMNLMVKIIDDFRHLLALIIVSIFFFALIYAMMYAGKTLEEKMDAIQTVVAALGGLIGSIIGYYFGESAGSRKKGVPEEVIEKNLKPSDETMDIPQTGSIDGPDADPSE